MIIKKEEKELYAFLKNAFNIMGQSTSKYLMGDKNDLYFRTSEVSGRVSILEKNKSLYDFQANFYTLKMLDDKSFEMEEILDDVLFDSLADAENARKSLINCFKDGYYKLDLDSSCTTILSLLTIYVNEMYIPDKFIKHIEKLGPCKVYAKDGELRFDTRKEKPRSSIVTLQSLYLDCRYVQPQEDEN